MELELWILLRLAIAAALSGAIGYERERTGKQAGLRTHMLVAVGATLFVSFTDLFVIAFLPMAPPAPPGNFRVQIEPLATVQACEQRRPLFLPRRVLRRSEREQRRPLFLPRRVLRRGERKQRFAPFSCRGECLGGASANNDSPPSPAAAGVGWVRATTIRPLLLPQREKGLGG